MWGQLFVGDRTDHLRFRTERSFHLVDSTSGTLVGGQACTVQLAWTSSSRSGHRSDYFVLQRFVRLIVAVTSG